MANVSSSNGLEKRPKLRFPGFDEPWQSTLLSSVFAKNTKKNTDGQVTNVICNSAKQGLIPQREYFDKDIANSDNTSGYYIIEENDFVYNPRKSADAPYGPISSYKYAEAGIVSPLYLCFRAKKKINPAFFEWYFRSSAWHRYVYMSGDSGARHDRVSIKDDTFFAMPINIPAAQEQERIASFLEKIDIKIEKQRALVEALKKYKRGAIKSLFTQEITLTEKSSKWEKHKMGDLITLQSGQDFAPSDYNDQGLGKPYMTGASCIVDGRTVVSRWTPVPRCIAYRGDTLLVCKGSGSGAVVMLSQDEVHIARQFMALRPREIMTKEFCFYLTLHLSEKMKQSATGLIEGIDRKTVLNQEVLLPSITEQEQITDFLLVLEKTLLLHEGVLKNLVSMKLSLLQQLFI